MKELKMYSSEYIMNTPMKPIEYCVDGLISQGLFSRVRRRSASRGLRWICACPLQKEKRFLEKKRPAVMWYTLV